MSYISDNLTIIERSERTGENETSEQYPYVPGYNLLYITEGTGTLTTYGITIQNICLVGGGGGGAYGGVGADPNVDFAPLYSGAGSYILQQDVLLEDGTFTINIGAGGQVGQWGGSTTFSYSSDGEDINIQSAGGVSANYKYDNFGVNTKYGEMYTINGLYYGGDGGGWQNDNENYLTEAPLGGGGGYGGAGEITDGFETAFAFKGGNGGGISSNYTGGNGGEAGNYYIGPPGNGTASNYGGGGGGGGGAGYGGGTTSKGGNGGDGGDGGVSSGSEAKITNTKVYGGNGSGGCGGKNTGGGGGGSSCWSEDAAYNYFPSASYPNGGIGGSGIAIISYTINENNPVGYTTTYNSLEDTDLIYIFEKLQQGSTPSSKVYYTPNQSYYPGISDLSEIFEPIPSETVNNFKTNIYTIITDIDGNRTLKDLSEIFKAK